MYKLIDISCCDIRICTIILCHTKYKTSEAEIQTKYVQMFYEDM
jgi:hypothetical protein